MEHLINLNFAPGGLPATVHVSQYDDTIRQLRFQLWFGRSKVEVPSGASVRVDIKKPDGHIVLVSGTVDSSDRSIVTVPTTKQMTAVPGGARGTLVVSSTGDKRISSAIFIMQVHRDPVEDGDASDSDLSMLQDAIDQTAANATAAQAAATAAQQAASSFTTDTTLTVTGAAADAKKTGDEITALKADLDALDSKVDNVKISDPVKEALLACFEHVALWIEGEGEEYIDALRTALGSIYPDLSTGNIIANYYYDASGNMVASNHSYCNEKYFEIENGLDYYWIQGFDGAVGGVKPDYTASMNAYRVCYYDENKNFISRQINDYSSEFGVIEPRYMKLTIPTGAKYFRVSWKYLPCGVICKTIPTNLYAVTLVLANLDDSEISDSSNIVSRFSVTRKGTDITQLIKTGIPNVTPEDSFELYGGWLRNVFNVLSGGSPEYGIQNLETMTRIHNKHTYIMRKGDVISFDNVKAGVRAERISDCEVQHNTAWITDNSDFVVGGES